jgi:N,N'-diacetyllegionaminate synthase
MKPVFVIAEAGVNHNGDEALALQLVDTAADCGADAVKFQTFHADQLVAKGTATAAYQRRATGTQDQHAMLRALELSDEAHARIAARCAERGIEFMSTPFDSAAVALLLGLDMRRIKIPSGEITNLPFLRELGARGLPLILSTGMATMEEIEAAVACLREAGHKVDSALTILHCTSNYPAAAEDVNLRALGTITARTGLPVGYSDHTLGIEVSLAAVALGATVIEKHFTMDKQMPGPDHGASLSPAELKDMVRGIRTVTAALGSAEKQPTASELPVRALVRRSVALARPVEAGVPLRRDDLVTLRPGTGIPPAALESLVGRCLLRHGAAGSTLHWSDLA